MDAEASYSTNTRVENCRVSSAESHFIDSYSSAPDNLLERKGDNEISILSSFSAAATSKNLHLSFSTVGTGDCLPGDVSETLKSPQYAPPRGYLALVSRPEFITFISPALSEDSGAISKNADLEEISRLSSIIEQITVKGNSVTESASFNACFTRLYHQLSVGCGSAKCETKLCRSCPACPVFDRNSSVVLAIKLSARYLSEATGTTGPRGVKSLIFCKNLLENNTLGSGPKNQPLLVPRLPANSIFGTLAGFPDPSTSQLPKNEPGASQKLYAAPSARFLNSSHQNPSEVIFPDSILGSDYSKIDSINISDLKSSNILEGVISKISPSFDRTAETCILPDILAETATTSEAFTSADQSQNKGLSSSLKKSSSSQADWPRLESQDSVTSKLGDFMKKILGTFSKRSFSSSDENINLHSGFIENSEQKGSCVSGPSRDTTPGFKSVKEKSYGNAILSQECKKIDIESKSRLSEECDSIEQHAQEKSQSKNVFLVHGTAPAISVLGLNSSNRARATRDNKGKLNASSVAQLVAERAFASSIEFMNTNSLAVRPSALRYPTAPDPITENNSSGFLAANSSCSFTSSSSSASSSSLSSSISASNEAHSAASARNPQKNVLSSILQASARKDISQSPGSTSKPKMKQSKTDFVMNSLSYHLLFEMIVKMSAFQISLFDLNPEFSKIERDLMPDGVGIESWFEFLVEARPDRSALPTKLPSPGHAEFYTEINRVCCTDIARLSKMLSAADVRFLTKSIRHLFSSDEMFSELFKEKTPFLSLESRCIFDCEEARDPAHFLNSQTLHESGLNLLSIRPTFELWLSIEPKSVMRNALSFNIEDAIIRAEESKNYFDSKARLRQLLILFETPLLDEIDSFERILRPVMTLTTRLEPRTKTVFIRWLSKYPPSLFRTMVGRAMRYLEQRLYPQHKPENGIITVVRFLALLYAANEQTPYNIINPAEFGCRKLATTIDFVQEHQKWLSILKKHNVDKEFSYFNYPFLLDTIAKSRIVRIDAMAQMNKKYEQACVSQAILAHTQRSWLSDGMLPGDLESSIQLVTNPYLVLEVRRAHLLQDVMEQIRSTESWELKKPLKIRFINEEGVDLGGVVKEFFQVLTLELMEPTTGLFTYDTAMRQCWFNARSNRSLGMYEIAGVIFGLAIYNSVVLSVRFPKIFYKLLQKHRPMLSDVEESWPDLGAGLRQVLEWSESAGDISDALGLTFEVATINPDGTVGSQALLPDKYSHETPVTNDNRSEYVSAYVDWVCVRSVKSQLTAFSKGMNRVCSGPAISMCRPEELELLLCGQDTTIDLAELEATCKYDGGYSRDDQTIVWFWEVAHAMTPDQKRKLLEFVTASDRVPLRGLGSLEFSLHRNGADSERLPTSMTCFSKLLLPEYTSKPKLEGLLLMAIENTRGFGLV